MLSTPILIITHSFDTLTYFMGRTWHLTATPCYYYNCTRTNNAGTCVARDVYPQELYIREFFCGKYIVVPYTYRVIWTFAKTSLKLGDTRFLRGEKRLRKIPHDNNDNHDNNNDNIVIYFLLISDLCCLQKKKNL